MPVARRKYRTTAGNRPEIPDQRTLKRALRRHRRPPPRRRGSPVWSTGCVSGSGAVAEDPDPRAALDGYLSATLATEWLRKSSFETRAFALVTANLGFVTLFLALRTQLDLAQRLDRQPASCLALLALAASVASIGAAVVSALPWNYPEVDPQALKDLSADIDAGGADDVSGQIREVRLSQLEKTVAANNIKGVSSLVGFVGLAVGAAALVAALVTAASLRP